MTNRRNNYDWDYPHRPGRPHEGYPPADNMTDQVQWEGLGPSDGDERVDPRMFNHPWGKVLKLTADKPSAALVQTESFPRPFPWAIQARFSVDGITFTPTVPASWGGTVTFRFVKSFDIKTGPAPETFVLEAEDALPICSLIARSLAVSVRIDGESVLNLWIQFVVCPTQQIDCAELVPVPPVVPAGFDTTLTTRDPADSSVTYTVPANPNRAYFVITNQSSAPLFVHLGVGVVTDEGLEFATIVLPGNAVGGYEVLNYRGVITWKFADDDATGYALATEGIAA